MTIEPENPGVQPDEEARAMEEAQEDAAGEREENGGYQQAAADVRRYGDVEGPVAMHELTLAVAGIDFPNADGSNRRSEAMMTLPGEPVRLVPEPRNRHDPNAIAIIGPHGVQIGYISAERAPYIGGRLRRGEAATAVFQGMEGSSAYIRVRFGDGVPTLPVRSDRPASPSPSPVRPPGPARSQGPDDEPVFYPDDDGPEWGA